MYRVYQTEADNPGLFTAFTQQYLAMQEEGITDPNPRQQILTDILKLIKEKRAEGFRLILMMNANGDYNHNTLPDKALHAFIQETGLVDPYHTCFPAQIYTYMYSKWWIDCILMGAELEQVVVRVSYLALYEGQKALWKIMKDTELHGRIIELVCSIARRGATTKNIGMYQRIDKELTQMALAAAEKIGHREYAYTRNLILTMQGRF